MLDAFYTFKVYFGKLLIFYCCAYNFGVNIVAFVLQYFSKYFERAKGVFIGVKAPTLLLQVLEFAFISENYKKLIIFLLCLSER